MHFLTILSDRSICRKTQELENRRDLYTPAFGPFEYHIQGKCKCLDEFLNNLNPEVLKQRQIPPRIANVTLVFIVKINQISHTAQVYPLLTFNK